MNIITSSEQPKDKSVPTRLVVKALVKVAAIAAVFAATLFISAGRLDWVMAWVYIGLLLAGICISAAIMRWKNPSLIDEHAEIKEGVKKWDKIFPLLLAVVGPIITLLLAGLDARFKWSPEIPPWLLVCGLVFFISGDGLTIWAMVSNKFFSAVVRIQKDRSHAVATGGPYRAVRHPGYAGVIIFNLSVPLVLGSLWAFIPVGLLICLIIIRTIFEDRTLQNELNGYKEYASHVCYRLMPGVW
jgi:protein-S-isoprenylcysteine O-methyltransferase Ste14